MFLALLFVNTNVLRHSGHCFSHHGDTFLGFHCCRLIIYQLTKIVKIFKKQLLLVGKNLIRYSYAQY